MANRLELGVAYRLGLQGHLKYGSVIPQRLYERFTDGRISGLLNEDLLQSLFTGLTRNDIGGGSHDLIDREGRKYEARTVTRHGVNLRPSNQKGQGRRIDDKAAMARRRDLYAFVFVDVRLCPRYRIYAVEAQKLGRSMGIKPHEFDELLAEARQKTLRI